MKTKKTLVKNSVSKMLFLLLFLVAFGLAGYAQNTQYGTGALQNNISGVENSAFGYNALFNNFYGNANVAVGHEALYKGFTQGPPDGSYNVAVGVRAMRNNSEGYRNSAFGNEAMRSNTHGSDNIAIGHQAMYLCTDSRFSVAVGNGSLYSSIYTVGNVAIGYYALHNNLQDVNTAVGYYALRENTDGRNNAALGGNALRDNTTGDNNSAFGADALAGSSTGNNNTAVGNSALLSNSTGYGNTANGSFSLSTNTTGRYNAAMGYYAMRDNTTGNYNAAHGTYALYNNTTGSFNSAIGYAAGYFSPATISNATSVGYLAYATASNRVRIGNTSVTQIGGQVSWSTLSDGRFKKNVKENVPGIEFIQQLRPVSYTIDNAAYEKHSGFSLESTDLDETAKAKWEKQQKENESIVYTGFIAQDVEEIIKKGEYNFSGVVVPENEKDHYSIRYAEFVVPLVKATQQQQQKLDEQTSKIQQLENEIVVLKQLIASLADKSNLNQETNAFESPVRCYPNPNKGMIYLEIENKMQENTEINVYDMSGNLVYAKKAVSNQEIDLSSQPNGTYIIKTKIGSKIYQNKVLLQK